MVWQQEKRGEIADVEQTREKREERNSNELKRKKAFNLPLCLDFGTWKVGY